MTCSRSRSTASLLWRLFVGPLWVLEDFSTGKASWTLSYVAGASTVATAGSTGDAGTSLRASSLLVSRFRHSTLWTSEGGVICGPIAQTTVGGRANAVCRIFGTCGREDLQNGLPLRFRRACFLVPTWKVQTELTGFLGGKCRLLVWWVASRSKGLGVAKEAANSASRLVFGPCTRRFAMGVSSTAGIRAILQQRRCFMGLPGGICWRWRRLYRVVGRSFSACPKDLFILRRTRYTCVGKRR